MPKSAGSKRCMTIAWSREPPRTTRELWQTVQAQCRCGSLEPRCDFSRGAKFHGLNARIALVSFAHESAFGLPSNTRRKPIEN
jgi:hypothetical protein